MNSNPSQNRPSVNLSNEQIDRSDPNKWPAIGLCALFAITVPAILGIVVMTTIQPRAIASTQSVATLTEPLPNLFEGQRVYKDSCMLCHGDSGQGTVGLGKPVRNSAYVQDSDDQALFELIANGRMPNDPLNTSGILMPARGAKNISDAQINHVMAYLRSIQDPTQPFASIEKWIVEPSPEDDSGEPQVALVGQEIFIASCSACHGAKGQGIEGLGKSFVTNEFVASSSDKELMTMIKMGRPVWDALNTTGLDMPSKGGNPAITDDQLNDIISYMRAVSTVNP